MAFANVDGGISAAVEDVICWGLRAVVVLTVEW